MRQMINKKGQIIFFFPISTEEYYKGILRRGPIVRKICYSLLGFFPLVMLLCFLNLGQGELPLIFLTLSGIGFMVASIGLIGMHFETRAAEKYFANKKKGKKRN